MIETPEELADLMRQSWVFSPQQWAAISAPLSPAVVIAGAGSGKTSLMAARVVWLVANKQVAPDEVLGLTFTTKAAAELRGRIREALESAGFGRGEVTDDGEALEPTVSTYNAYAAALLAEHGLRIGHEPDTRVLADASRYQLAGRAIARHRGRVRLLTDSPQHVIDYVVGLESAMSEHLVASETVREHDALLRPRVVAALEAGPKGELPKVLDALDKRAELLGVVDDYRALKRELGLMDFSDQIALAATLAEEQPEVGVLEREKFRIVLLDEYQDTSVAQAQMLGRLFSGPDPDHGRGHPVTAVGDPNQAIYGWRGASVSNILGFGRDFPAADGSTDVPAYPLTVNRRSDARILEVANVLARPLYDGRATVQPLEPKPDADEGAVRTIVHETYPGELEWLAGEVKAAHESGTEWREIGVLTRDNAHAADVFDTLSARGVPVEIVGLNGLLRLPEVSEVVATLTLVADLTANAELLQLLSGPRWAVGPRDLALLGRRARELAGAAPARSEARPSLADELAAAVAGADPAEVTALSDALDDPGPLPYSAAARERFGLLATELRQLRAHAGEPLLELVRRIIDTCGIDVELAASVGDAARARRDNLDLFVKAVAEFQAVDGDVSLSALLAYLTAEDELGTGLDVATPSEADSVKLLTVHRAKGLEWDVVFLPGACEEKFPHKQLRSQWTRSPSVLPIPLRGDERDLPPWREISAQGLTEFTQAARDHQAEEELRLAYVALTRARHLLWVSSYLWTESRKTPLGPSPYQQSVRATLRSWGADADAWHDKPAKDAANPTLAGVAEVAWPVTEHTAEALLRLEAVELVRLHAEGGAGPDEDDLDLVERVRVEEWDAEIDRLLAEARAERTTTLDVPLPTALSATALARLRSNPDELARELARPMPRRPSPAARFGTRFHAWVEARFGQQQLLDPDELPGRGDTGIDDEDDLRALIAAFESGPFADRPPLAVEAPFALVLGGQVVRGRIDAVYQEPDGGFLVVDWKTNRAPDADPLQLAAYRLAWAELSGVPVERVRAVFVYVRTGQVVEPPGLPDRAGLEELLSLS